MTYTITAQPNTIVRDEDGRIYRGQLTYVRGLNLDEHFAGWTRHV